MRGLSESSDWQVILVIDERRLTLWKDEGESKMRGIQRLPLVPDFSSLNLSILRSISPKYIQYIHMRI